MTSGTERWITVLVIVATACEPAEEPARPRPREPEPPAQMAEPVASEPNAHELDAPEPATPAPQAEPAPSEAEVEAASIERAIEPVEDGATIVASVERGRSRYVLFQWNGAAVARERILAEENGEDRLDAFDGALESCDDEDDYSRYDCVVRAVPDAYLAASALGDGHAWGVAVVEARDGTFVRTARRFLFAWSEDEGSVLDRAAELRARDVDADGEAELIVTLPIVPLRSDLRMNGLDEAVVAYVLDPDDLRTQLRVTSDYTSSVMDVAGTTTSCRGAWRFADVNHDAHDDIAIRARCSADWQDEESGDSRRTPTSDRRECLYDSATDAWPCGEPPIAAWLFDGGDSGAVVAETPETLGAALGDLGSQFSAIAAARDDERAGEAEDAPPAPSPLARACVHIVDDPAPPLRVRTAPSTRSDVAGELANGTELVLLERRGRWARIDRPTVGWVFTENVRERCGEP